MTSRLKLSNIYKYCFSYIKQVLSGAHPFPSTNVICLPLLAGPEYEAQTRPWLYS